MATEHFNCRCAFLYIESDNDEWLGIGEITPETNPQIEYSAIDLAEMHLAVVEAERILND